jgi:hypothetical protein
VNLLVRQEVLDVRLGKTRGVFKVSLHGFGCNRWLRKNSVQFYISLGNSI